MKLYSSKNILIAILIICIPILLFVIYKTTMIKRMIIIIPYGHKIDNLNSLNNINLLLLDIDKIKNQLRKSNYFIKKIDLKKEYPDSLIINAEVREPYALLKEDDKDFYIDNEAVLLDYPVTNTDLPSIQIKGIFFVFNQQPDWRLVKAVKLIDLTSKMDIGMKNIVIDIEQNNYTAIINDETLITIPYQSDISKIAASLQIIISRFRIEGKKIKKIDFQFDNPVIILSNGS